MAIIVETGAGLPNSEAYTSVAEADAYHKVRGREATWKDLDVSVKEQKLREATDYMVQVYRQRWVGYRSTVAQALDWPRADARKPDTGSGYGAAYFPVDQVPAEVKRACAELAFRALTTSLSPDLATPKESVTVGPITVRYGQNPRQQTRYQAVDDLLGPLLDGYGSNSFARVGRA
jgi:hypothetical protein